MGSGASVPASSSSPEDAPRDQLSLDNSSLTSDRGEEIIQISLDEAIVEGHNRMQDLENRVQMQGARIESLENRLADPMSLPGVEELLRNYEERFVRLETRVKTMERQLAGPMAVTTGIINLAGAVAGELNREGSSVSADAADEPGENPDQPNDNSTSGRARRQFKVARGNCPKCGKDFTISYVKTHLKVCKPRQNR